MMDQTDELTPHALASLKELIEFIKNNDNEHNLQPDPEVDKLVDDFFEYCEFPTTLDISYLPEMCKLMTRSEWKNMLWFILQQFEGSRKWFEQQLKTKRKGFDDKQIFIVLYDLGKYFEKQHKTYKDSVQTGMVADAVFTSCEILLQKIPEAIEFVYLLFQKYFEFFSLTVLQHKETPKVYVIEPNTSKYGRSFRFHYR